MNEDAKYDKRVLVSDIGQGVTLRIERSGWVTTVDVILPEERGENFYKPPIFAHLYFHGTKDLKELRDCIDAALRSATKFEQEHTL